MANDEAPKWPGMTVTGDAERWDVYDAENALRAYVQPADNGFRCYLPGLGVAPWGSTPQRAVNGARGWHALHYGVSWEPSQWRPESAAPDAKLSCALLKLSTSVPGGAHFQDSSALVLAACRALDDAEATRRKLDDAKAKLERCRKAAHEAYYSSMKARSAAWDAHAEADNHWKTEFHS